MTPSEIEDAVKAVHPLITGVSVTAVDDGSGPSVQLDLTIHPSALEIVPSLYFQVRDAVSSNMPGVRIGLSWSW